jgi:putative hydrolase of the HAD superfamily
LLPFDVILFDVGGVLLTNGWDHGERAAAVAHFGIDGTEFERLHASAYDAWERGAIDCNEYMQRCVFTERRCFTQVEFYEFLLSGSKLLKDGALGILSEISASKKYVVGALNNEAREPNGFRFEKFGLSKYFVLRMSSCYLGLRKPEAAIYRRALDILDRPAERVLFIDDREENIAAAEAVGMKAVQFLGAESLRDQLKEQDVF